MKRSGSYLIVFLLLAFFISCGKDKEIVAVIGNTVITEEDLHIASQRKATLMGKGSLTPGEKKELLDDMIKREILCLYAKQNNIKPKPEEINAELKRLNLAGLSDSERRFLKKETEKNLILQELRKEFAKDINIKHQDIEDYYRKNINDYTEPETYRVYLLQIKESDAVHLVEVFNKNPDAFDKNALENTTPELKKLNRSAPFIPLSGFPDEMVPLLKQAKKGKVYGPVKTRRGVFLFKLVDKRPPRIKPLAEVYHEISHLLTEEMINKRLEDVVSSMKGRVEIKFQK